jgi:hypothetical protein
MANQHIQDWSLNLSPGVGVCWELSDSECEGDAKRRNSSTEAITVSSDAILMSELDLAARPDTATYNANPWTIAKLNSYSRSRIERKSIENTLGDDGYKCEQMSRSGPPEATPQRQNAKAENSSGMLVFHVCF